MNFLNYLKQLDRNLNFNERLQLVNKILSDSELLDILNNAFEKNINGGGDNELRFLNALAAYLVNASDIKSKDAIVKSDKKMKEFWDDKVSLEQMFKNLSHVVGRAEAERIITEKVEEVSKRIVYKPVRQKITKKDIEELQPVKEYQQAIDKLQEQRKHTDDVNKQRLISKVISSMRQDQLICKDGLRGTIYFKRVDRTEGKTDWDQFDFLDFQQVKALLHINPNRYSLLTDLGCLLYDLTKLIEQTKFSERQEKIIKMLRNECGYKYIMQKLKINKITLHKEINKIAKKIMRTYYIQLEDWYYLNVVKGKYKRCSKCGQIKLATETYFSPDKRNSDGLHSVCKECRKFYVKKG